jgi:hypothetical protein
MRYAVIDNGDVVNVALWDGVTEWEHADNAVNVEGLSVGPGWRYENSEWVAPTTSEDATDEP